MNVLLAQIILLAQGEDVGKWTNIFFVIVLAVFWMVGSIIKARAKKPEGEEEKQGQLGRKPGGKLREVAERLERELTQLSRDRAYKPPPQPKGAQRGPSRRPGQTRPAGPEARVQYDLRGPRGPSPVAGPRAAARRPGARPGSTPAPAPRPPARPEASLEMSAFTTGIKGLPQYTTAPVEGLKDSRAHISAEKPAAQSPLEALLDLDYAHPDELKKAILHYEILGKPVSLRQPGADAIGV